MKHKTLKYSFIILSFLFFSFANAQSLKNVFRINRPFLGMLPTYSYNFFKADISKWDFSNFTELGEENIEALNLSGQKGYQPMLSNEFGVIFMNAIYTGVNFGFVGYNSRNNTHQEKEVYATKYRKHNFGLNVGYQLLNNRHSIFTPKANIQWNRFRLASFPRENEIPLDDYLANRDLDIRFHQFTGFLGGDLAFRLYDNFFDENLTLNIYGGYQYKLHKKPIIRSEGNKLLTEKQIDVGNFVFGFGFSVLFP